MIRCTTIGAKPSLGSSSEERDRIAHQRARDGQHLLLAAGKPAGLTVAQRRQHRETRHRCAAGSNSPDRPVRFLAAISRLSSTLCSGKTCRSSGTKPTPARAISIRLAALHVAAHDGDAATARRRQSGNRLERRAFAGAVAAEQCHGLPLGQLDVDAEQDLARPVEDVDLLHAEQDAGAHDRQVLDCAFPGWCRDRRRSPPDCRGFGSGSLPPARGRNRARGSIAAILNTMSMSCSMNTSVIFCRSHNSCDLGDHLPAFLRPHARRRLVEQQHARLERQRQPDIEQLLVAMGETGRQHRRLVGQAEHGPSPRRRGRGIPATGSGG